MIPGDVATLTYALTVGTTLTNATVSLTVTSPAGVVTTPAVTNPSTGNYASDVPVNASGRWSYLWTATGAATDAEAGTFRVEAVSLQTSVLKVRLNYLPTQTQDDTELADVLAAAVDVVEGEVGPISSRTVVESVTSYDGTALLRSFPVASITTEGLTLLPGGVVSGLAYGTTEVTYVAGAAPTAAQAEAVYLVAADLWQTQRGQGQTDDTGQYVLTPILHRRVRELLAPTRLGPAIG